MPAGGALKGATSATKSGGSVAAKASAMPGLVGHDAATAGGAKNGTTVHLPHGADDSNGSCSDDASVEEVVILVLNFLKKKGFESSYKALAEEGTRLLPDLVMPQEPVRDLHEILNEYLILLQRNNETKALVASEHAGRKIRQRVSHVFECFGQLLDDYIAAREHVAKHGEDPPLTPQQQQQFLLLSQQQHQQQQAQILHAGGQDVDMLSPVVAAGSRRRANTNGGQVSSSFPGNKKVSGNTTPVPPFDDSACNLMSTSILSASTPPEFAHKGSASSVSDVVGSMSAQLKQRDSSSSYRATQSRSGSTTPRLSTGSSAGVGQKRKKKDSGIFATPRKDFADFGLSNLSFTGSVTPIDMDGANLSRSRILPLDDPEISLADLGANASSSVFFDYDNNKTSRSLLNMQYPEASLGSILEGPASLLGPPRTSFSNILLEATNNNSRPLGVGQPAGAAAPASPTSPEVPSTGQVAPEAKKKKRRITPTTIRTKSSSASSSRKASPSSRSKAGKSVVQTRPFPPKLTPGIVDVDTFLDGVHKPRAATQAATTAAHT